VKYEKPALTVAEQVERLRQRGLEGDPVDMAERLAKVSYYRLTGYSFPFRNSDDTFRAGTTFRAIWDHYVFDRRLRLLAMDALERVEVAVRTRLSYELGHRYGPFGYANVGAVFTGTSELRSKLLDGIRGEVERAKKEQFLEHFFDKYREHRDPPVWMATEVLSFGNVVRMVSMSRPEIQKKVTDYFGLPDEVVLSWLRTLNVIRNVCAHHSRLWNRRLPMKPLIPARHTYPDWHQPIRVPNDRMFTVFTQCIYLLGRLSPGSTWKRRLIALLDEYSQVSRRSMGFPENWEECPIWKGTLNG
jgi:abortive infection bacteriophage resistance protein